MYNDIDNFQTRITLEDLMNKWQQKLWLITWDATAQLFMTFLGLIFVLLWHAPAAEGSLPHLIHLFVCPCLSLKQSKKFPYMWTLYIYHSSHV